MSVIGPDVSFYQDNNSTARKIDFRQMRTAGAAFVIIRAGQNLWPDPDFGSFWYDAKAAGLPRGSYWFYDSRVDPVQQAQLWLETLGNDQGELPMFLDIEYNYGGNYWGPENFRTMLEYLKIRTKHELGIYTAYYVWRDNVPSANRPYFSQYVLWTANYGVSAPSIPPGWSNWTFWQYTSTGDGAFYGVESKGIDLNYFNGDLPTFRARFGLDGGTPPPVIDPPSPVEEPKQKGVVIVGALNVRNGPGIQYAVVNGLLRDDIAYGNVDPATNWMRISQIKRIADGSLESLDGWASAKPDYMRVSSITTLPPAGGDSVSGVTYANGVQVYSGRFNGHSDFRMLIIPPASIAQAGMFRPDGCRLVENVIGDKDFAFNFATFNAPCTPNRGVRVNGVEYQKYDGLYPGSYAPFFWWDDGNRLQITHKLTTWKTLGSALQGFRYVIEAGVKNPRANADWDLVNPQRVIGRLPDGSTVALSIAGRGYLDSQGATLHEVAAFLLDYGCDYAIDGDGGGSVRDVLRVDGQLRLYKGTIEDRGCPAGGVIRFMEPIVDTAPEPPVEPPAAGNLPFVLDVVGYQPFSGELIPDVA